MKSLTNDEQHRRARLAVLIKEIGQKELSALTEIAESYLWQMSKGTGTNSRKISDARARHIESRANRPPGWLDENDSESQLRPARADSSAGFPVPQMAVFGSMGDGSFFDPPQDIVTQISVDMAHLRRLVNFTAPENLSFITGLGDSMEPTFHDGDPLLIDTGVREHKLDAVYVLTVNEKLYVKTLQRRPDGAMLMISDNKKYDPYTIKESDMPVIHGRVLLAWNARRI